MSPERQERFTEQDGSMIIVSGPQRGTVLGLPGGAPHNAADRAILDATDEDGNTKPGATWPPAPI